MKSLTDRRSFLKQSVAGLALFSLAGENVKVKNKTAFSNITGAMVSTPRPVFQTTRQPGFRQSRRK